MLPNIQAPEFSITSDFFGLTRGPVDLIINIKTLLNGAIKNSSALLSHYGSNQHPTHLWFLCICYIFYVFNRCSDPTLNHRTSLFLASGRTIDISAVATFKWLQPVYFHDHDSYFLSKSKEKLGYWAGIAEHVGHDMTYLIWLKGTKTILPRSCVRFARDHDTHNLRAVASDDLPFTAPPSGAHAVETGHEPTDQEYGENEKGRPSGEFIYHSHNCDPLVTPGLVYGEPNYLQEDSKKLPEKEDPSQDPDSTGPIFVVLIDDYGNPKTDSEGNSITMKGLTSEELQGITFLKRHDDCTKLRACVLEKIDSQQEGNKVSPKYRIKYDTNDVEDIMAYNDII